MWDMASTKGTTLCRLMSRCWMGCWRSSFFVGIACIGYQRFGLDWRGFYVNLTRDEIEVGALERPSSDSDGIAERLFHFCLPDSAVPLILCSSKGSSVNANGSYPAGMHGVESYLFLTVETRRWFTFCRWGDDEQSLEWKSCS